MGKRLTTQEILDREDFVFSQISKGITRREIHSLIKGKFDLSDRGANNVYNAAANNCPRSSPKEYRFNKEIILTAHANQIKSAHADMIALQILIDEALDQTKTRKALITEYLEAQTKRREEIAQELKAAPPIKPTIISSIIGQKNQVRAQLGKTLSDMSRILGLYADMPLLQAINVMASSELLPPDIANKMLEAIEDISSSIEQSMQKEIINDQPVNDDFNDSPVNQEIEDED